MDKRFFLSFILLSALFISAAGQQYDARGYWKMEHDSAYSSLIERQRSGALLSSDEQSFLFNYKTKLTEYFEKMSDAEKSEYYKNRATWNGQPGSVNFRDEEQIYAGERSTFTRYVVASGIWGGLYGLSFDYIFDVSGSAAAGLPLIVGGMSSILPILTIKDKKVTTNSLLLSNHGKSFGAFQGAMLGLLFTGGTESDSDGKIVAGIATVSSIAFGHIGYSLGKTKEWSQGRVCLYTHYGWLMSLEGAAIMASFNTESPRLTAFGSMVGGLGGYILADRIADKNNYTRGDVTSIQTLTLLNAGLGLGIMTDINSSSNTTILIPAAGALAGTIIGQAWMKNARLTNQQGRNIALGTAGGAVVGLGLSVLIFSEGSSANYIIPYITGLATYSIIAETYRTKNIQSTSLNKSTNGFHFSFMPQNILINNKIISSGKYRPGSRFSLLPAFAATLSF